MPVECAALTDRARFVTQLQVSSSKDGFELCKEDCQVLSLRNRGLWRSEIAVLLGMSVRSVDYRLERLKKAGFTFPPPTAPRPIPHRKVTDDELLALASRAFQSPRSLRGLGWGWQMLTGELSVSPGKVTGDTR